MKKMMVLCKSWNFSVQKVLIYHTVNKSHHNSFILLVFSHVANFRYVANFRFLTLYIYEKICLVDHTDIKLRLYFMHYISCRVEKDERLIIRLLKNPFTFKKLTYLNNFSLVAFISLMRAIV